MKRPENFEDDYVNYFLQYTIYPCVCIEMPGFYKIALSFYKYLKRGQYDESLEKKWDTIKKIEPYSTKGDKENGKIAWCYKLIYFARILHPDYEIYVRSLLPGWINNRGYQKYKKYLKF